MTAGLEGRVVLVTGASAGIGRALAGVLVEHGAKVVGMARGPEAGDDLVSELAAGPGSIAFVAGDVAVSADCDRAVAEAVERHGRLDVLVNNAAKGTPLRRVEGTSDEDWDAIVEPTLAGAFRMSRAAIPVMRRQGGGAILNVASVGGVAGGATEHFGAYGAAKAGVIQLARVIAVENLDRKVTANTIVMGGVDTEMSRGVFGEMLQVLAPAGIQVDEAALAGASELMMQPEQVARSISLLCSRDASQINGATINLDDCWSIGRWVSATMHLGAPAGITAEVSSGSEL